MAQSPTPTINVSYGYYPPVNGFYARNDAYVTFTSDGAVYYTTDGSTPTTGSTQWDYNPIYPQADTTYKAIAVVGADDPSDVATQGVSIAEPPTIDIWDTPTIDGREVELSLLATTPDLDLTSGTLSWGDGTSDSLTAGDLSALNGAGTRTVSHTYAGTGTYDISLSVYDPFSYDSDNLDDVEVTHEDAYALVLVNTVSVGSTNTNLFAVSPSGRWAYVMTDANSTVTIHRYDMSDGSAVDTLDIYGASSYGIAVTSDEVVYSVYMDGAYRTFRCGLDLDSASVEQTYAWTTFAPVTGLVDGLALGWYGFGWGDGRYTTMVLLEGMESANIYLRNQFYPSATDPVGYACYGLTGRRFIHIGQYDSTFYAELWEINTEHTSVTKLAGPVAVGSDCPSGVSYDDDHNLIQLYYNNTNIGYDTLRRYDADTLGLVDLQFNYLTYGAGLYGADAKHGLVYAYNGNYVYKFADTADLFPPTIDPPGPNGYTPMTVEMAALDPDAVEIRYTLDGTTPTISSTLYADPITVQHRGTLTIKAVCVDASDALSAVRTTVITYRPRTAARVILVL
jgi:hypothetical protein